MGSYIRLWIWYICQPNAFQGIETMKRFHTNPSDIYLLKFNNRNTRTRCEICPKLTINTPKRRQPFLDPLKTSENHKAFWCFQEEEKVQSAPTPLWRGDSFWCSCLKRGERSKKNSKEEEKGGRHFLPLFWRGELKLLWSKNKDLQN